jgi:hypothetical protein
MHQIAGRFFFDILQKAVAAQPPTNIEIGFSISRRISRIPKIPKNL